MAEDYENYHKNDIRLRFRIILPNGEYAKVTDPKTLKESTRVDYLTPEEVTNEIGMGRRVEQVEPKHFDTFIEKSQTTHDKQ